MEETVQVQAPAKPEEVQTEVKVELKVEPKKRKTKEELKHIHMEEIKKLPKSVITDFRDFLEEYKVLGLAIAVIMGLASNTLVKALVDNIIMPIITPFIPGGGWQTATLKIGPIVLGWGAFLSALIYFLILAWAVFLIVRYMFGKKKVAELK